jgi:hypothetical protein
LFGQNAMELDTTVRPKLPLLCVISLIGGWTGDPEHNKPGRDLGHTLYDKMAEALGCYAEYVEEPEEIRPALGRRSRRGWSALFRPRHDGALFEPRDLNGRFHVTRGAPPGTPSCSMCAKRWFGVG